MKKFTYLFSFLSLALTASMFTSCKSSETVAPTVEFANNNANTISVEIGGTFDITAKMKSDENASLKKLTVTKSSSLGLTTKEFELSGTSFDKVISDTMPAGVTQIIYTFMVLDNKDKSTSATFTVNLKQSAYKAIDTYNSLQVDNQNNNSGQQFLTLTPATGQIPTFTIADAKINSAKIDLCYGSATTSGNFIAAPGSAKAKLIYDNSGMDKISTWATINNTQFKKINMTLAQYNAMNNDSAIIYNADGVGMAPEITNITSDIFVAFVARNKKGIMYVKNATGSLSTIGAAQIEWKVQQ